MSNFYPLILFYNIIHTQMLREWTVSRDSGGLIWQLGVSRGFSEGNFRKVMREEWG